MEMTKQEAQDSLDQIQATAGKTRCAIAASYDSGLLIMWGLIWIAAFLGTHFFGAWAGYIWLVLLRPAGINSAQQDHLRLPLVKRLGGAFSVFGVSCLSICSSGFPF